MPDLNIELFGESQRSPMIVACGAENRIAAVWHSNRLFSVIVNWDTVLSLIDSFKHGLILREN